MSRLPKLGTRLALCGIALAGSLGLTGCMAEYSGQNLPSPYYLSSQIQYFPPGPEFKLSKEAEAQKIYKETEAERQGTLQ